MYDGRSLNIMGWKRFVFRDLASPLTKLSSMHREKSQTNILMASYKTREITNVFKLQSKREVNGYLQFESK